MKRKNQVIKLTKESIAKEFRDSPIEQIDRKHVLGKHTEEVNKAVLVYIKIGESIKVLKNRYGNVGIVTADELDAMVKEIGL